ncbi:GTPase IMAP family member 4-like [Mizuhopecten yessoensis]|uniref:GTPase IMAP family member 4 n=1 Tax=Mizuhopecten yessoensis TaxID=6573 RepID=A0A210R208_MIZYE|nr:GTPase IMAP family member 4-like [Mizuhopecten yessoensis]OWF55120.1 GTPase IMAP family member 4 [Mizuhopecten yessoensis]
MARRAGGADNDRWQAPFDWRDFPFEEVKILIFGKQKQGKSSLGNLILGDKLLDVIPEPGQAADPWSCACNTFDGKQITVVDIPGHIPKAVEIMFSRKPLFPGPHALLFVIDGTASFTKQDKEYFEGFLNNFDNDVTKHIIPVITHFDQIENNEETYIQDIVNNNRYLKAVFRACDQRYVLIDSSPQRSHEDGQRIKQQQRLVLNAVSSLVRTRKTVFISEQMVDKISKQNDQKRLTRLVTDLIQADKQMLLKYSKKHGGTLPREIRDLLQNIPSKEMQVNYRVLRKVTGMLNQRHDAVALDTEMDDVATVITQHTDLLMKYDTTSTLTVDNASTIDIGTVAAIVGGVVVVAAILLGNKAL